jgi:hypothetical protein
VEGHLALVAVLAEVLDDVLRPLVRLAEHHPVRVELVHLLADPLEEVVGLREVLAVRADPLEQVRHGVQAEAVDAHVEPELQHVDHGLLHGRVVVVEVRLVAEEAVPEVLLADRVPGPVRGLGVDEDDPRLGVRLVGVGPHVVVAVRALGSDAEAWNHGCWSLEWFMTRSAMMRMPRLCASSTSCTKSPRSPNSGSTFMKSLMS